MNFMLLGARFCCIHLNSAGHYCGMQLSYLGYVDLFEICLKLC